MTILEARELAQLAKTEIESIVHSFERTTGLRLHLYRGNSSALSEVDVEGIVLTKTD